MPIQKLKLVSSIGKTIIDEIFTNTAGYYFALGMPFPWDDELSPDTPIKTEKYEKTIRDNFCLIKKLDRNSVSYVIPRINYKPNIVYDIYDDIEDNSGKLYYVLNSEYNVYKCLFNNNQAFSTVEPSGTGINQFTTSDGYVWKYIYSIPSSIRQKFLTSAYMPVYNAVTEKYYSRGSINSVLIDNSGKNYDESTTLLVTGDGFLESDPQKIVAWDISVEGSGYLSNPTATVDDLTPTAINFSNNMTISSGQRVRVSDASGVRIYIAENSGTLGTVAPNHYYTSSLYGNVYLKHLKTIPKATATISATGVGSAYVIDGGFGYTIAPTVTKADGTGTAFTPTISSGVVTNVFVDSNGTGCVNETLLVQSPYPSAVPFAQSTSYNNGDIVYRTVSPNNTYFYLVGNTGTSGTSNPSHTTGATMNGSILLTVVAKQAVAGCVLGYVNAITLYSDLNSVSILNNGTGYSPLDTITFSGGNPVSHAQGNLVVVGGKIVDIVITYPGYGYESTPSITINTSTGTGASFIPVMQYGYGYETAPLINISAPTSTNTNKVNAIGSTTTQKTEAKLKPVIVNGSIRGVEVIDAGVNYTYAVITVSSSGEGATLTPVFNAGDLLTSQSDNQTQAIDGTISSVVVLDGGSGITSINPVIVGDGTGLTVTPVLSNGVLTKLLVNTAGQNYSYVDINFIVNSGAESPSVRAIISPSNGHGHDPISEFTASALSFYGVFDSSFINGMNSSGQYRQVSIVKSPLKYGENSLFNSRIGYALFNATVSGNLSYATSGTVLSNGNKKYKIVHKSGSAILLSSPNTLNVGDVLSYTVTGVTYQLTVSNILNPSFNAYSGDILYIDNRLKFVITDEQKITINTIVKLD